MAGTALFCAKTPISPFSMAYEIGLSTPEVPNRGFPLWVCSVVFVIVAGMFVMTRLAVRFHYRGLGTDDWMILASLVGPRCKVEVEASANRNRSVRSSYR